MNRTMRRSLLLGGVALSLVMAACGSDSSSSDTTSAAPASEAASSAAPGTAGGAETTAAAGEDLSALSATLNASGATFPQAFYEEAIAAFKDDAPDVTINYGGGGSGKGRQDLADQVVDFAGSDGPCKDEDVAEVQGRRVPLLPDRARPDHRLLQPPRRRQAAADARDDRQDLPARDQELERPGHRRRQPRRHASRTRPSSWRCRADGSGTTENFTKFLDAAVGADGSGTWKLKSGSTVEWPADTQAGQGNSGVAQIVKLDQGRHRLRRPVRRQGRRPQVRQRARTRPASSSSPPSTPRPPRRPTSRSSRTSPSSRGWADGDEAYPIAAQTWIIVYTNQTDKAKGEALKAYLKYMLTDGPGDGRRDRLRAAARRSAGEGHRAARPARDPLLLMADRSDQPEGQRRAAPTRPSAGWPSAAAAVVLVILSLIAVTMTKRSWPVLEHMGLRLLHPDAGRRPTRSSAPWPSSAARCSRPRSPCSSRCRSASASPCSSPRSRRRWLRRPVVYIIDLLAVVPSVVFGLWGVLVFSGAIKGFYGTLHDVFGAVPLLGKLFGPPRPPAEPS